MEVNKIIILGRIPSKKNSRITTRSGRSFPSAKYKEWHTDASWQMKGKKIIPNGSFITLNFYMPDNRRADLTNKAESIMDCLVDNGLLKDDSWQIVPSLTLQFQEVDKIKPRCEIIW